MLHYQIQTRSAPNKIIQRLDLKLAPPVGINSHLRKFHEWNGARLVCRYSCWSEREGCGRRLNGQRDNTGVPLAESCMCVNLLRRMNGLSPSPPADRTINCNSCPLRSNAERWFTPHHPHPMQTVIWRDWSNSNASSHAKFTLNQI